MTDKDDKKSEDKNDESTSVDENLTEKENNEQISNPENKINEKDKNQKNIPSDQKKSKKRHIRGITKEEKKLVETSAFDQLDEIVKASSVSDKKTQTLKLKRKIGYVFLGILALTALYYVFSRPAKGSLMYGACKTFLELQLDYPSTLRISKIEEFWESVRIWHAYIDGFGEFRMEPIECFFKTDEMTGMFTFEKVTIRRREVDQNTVEKFNKIIPTFYVQAPDLTIPRPLPDSLQDLQIDYSRILKPIL